MRLDGPDDGALEYIDFFHLPFALRADIRRVLFIGLGCGSGPRQFQHDYTDVQMDVVEIDPAVVVVAREFFGVEESADCVIHVDDGLEFLAKSERQWDVIVVDAYRSESEEPVIPEGFVARKFFALSRTRLTDDGVLVFNCAAASHHKLTKTIARNIASSYPFLASFECLTSDNVVLLASAEPLEKRGQRISTAVRRAIDSGRLKREALMRRVRQQRVEF
jgi:spermidine synthase